MYWCYECPLNLYREEIKPFYLVPLTYFQEQIKLGRQGHFYKTRIADPASMPVVVQLFGIDAGNKMVQLNVFSSDGTIELQSFSENDLYGITYLGPIAPPPQPKPQSHRPPWCAQYPWGPGC